MDIIIKRYEEVRDIIPMTNLAIESAKSKNTQTLYGNVLDWLRDYYNEPKRNFCDLATYLIGEYAVNHFLQDELVNKK